MRTRSLVPALALLVAPSAWALPTTVPALADFDVGYRQCEKRYAAMRGHGDEAYAAVWKHALDAKLKAQLVAARASAEYANRKKSAPERIGKDTSADAAKKVARQCQGVWQETGLTPIKLAE